MSYATWASTMFRGVLAGQNGQNLAIGYGLTLNNYYERAQDVVRQRYPSYAYPDALSKIGACSRLYRAPTEPLPSYRSRVLNRWTKAQNRGTQQGILDDLSSAGMTNAVIIPNWQVRYGATYPLDDRVDEFVIGRYWSLVLYQPHPFGASGHLWGDSNPWLDGKHWGTEDETRSINYVIWLMRYHNNLAAIARELIVVLTPGGTLDVSGNPNTGTQAISIDTRTKTLPIGLVK